MPYTYTNQKQIRKAFWESHPDADRKKIKDFRGTGKMHVTDTRVAFCDFLDYLQKDGQISEKLAQRTTL